MVPNGWSLKLISDTAKVITGNTPSTKDSSYYNGDIPFVSPADLGANKLISSANKTLTKKGFEKSRAVRKGSTLFTCIGSTIGKLGQANCELATNQQINAVIPYSSFDDDFIYYQLEMRAKFISKLAGTQAVPIINKTTFESQNLLVPDSLPEQRKIAQILSTWERGIATTEKLIDASKQQKKALMQQLLTGKKRLIDPETGKAFEGEWEEVKLGDLGKTFTGLTGKTKEHFGRGSKYIPYINIFRNSSVDMNALELVDVRPNEKQNLVKYGDIFFTTSSETPEEVGMSSVILEEIDESVYLNSFCFGFRPHNFNRVKPEFIRYLLRSEKVRRSISLLAQGATRYNLSKTQLLKITLNIPSLGEQQKIASVLTAADKDIELLEAKLAHFKQEKKALMQQLLTGKRRVKVAKTEAA